MSQNSIDDAQQTLDLTERQYQSGSVSQLNVFETKRGLAGEQASHSKLQQSLIEAQNSLAILYNQPPLKMPILIEKLPEGDIPTIAAGIPADLLSNPIGTLGANVILPVFNKNTGRQPNRSITITII